MLKNSFLLIQFLFMALILLFSFIDISQASVIPTFNDYSIKRFYKGPSKLPNFKNDEMGQEYLQFKLEGSLAEMRKGPNFAGHYFVLEGGCGTNCTFAYIADNKTGTYWKFPTYGWEKRYMFKLHSRLIKEMVHTEPTYGNCILSMYIMNEKSLKRIYRKKLGAANYENGCPDANTVRN